MTSVLLVEDSPTVMRHLRQQFDAAAGFRVVGEATSAAQAVQETQRLKPGLVVLDVFLPDGSAEDVVRRLLDTHPVPIVLVSDAPRDSREVFAALEAGALDFLPKPARGDAAAVERLLLTAEALSRVRVRRRPRRPRPRVRTGGPLRLVAIGASAAGPAPLKAILSLLPADLGVPVVVAQHLAAGFEEGFVRYLQEGCRLRVRMASVSEPLLRPGEVVVGRPEHDVRVEVGGLLRLEPAPPRGFHPSVDLLFASASAVYGAGLAALVLSGMGRDGAVGAEDVVRAGGVVMAQDRGSCGVYGMPAAVAEAGVCGLVGPPERLARALLDLERLRRSPRLTEGVS